MSRHVFCVDAEPSFLSLLRELFEEEQYRVTTAGFTPHIFEQIVALQPDIVILDLGVGTSDGWDLLAQLEERPETTALPVVIVSTDPRQLADAEAATPASRAHLRACRAKPFDIDDLVGDVARLLAER